MRRSPVMIRSTKGRVGSAGTADVDKYRVDADPLGGSSQRLDAKAGYTLSPACPALLYAPASTPSAPRYTDGIAPIASGLLPESTQSK
jgi:hypothetical protein